MLALKHSSRYCQLAWETEFDFAVEDVSRICVGLSVLMLFYVGLDHKRVVWGILDKKIDTEVEKGSWTFHQPRKL